MSLTVGVVIGSLAAVGALTFLGVKWSLDMRIVLQWIIGLAIAAGVIICVGGSRLGLSGWVAMLVAGGLTCISAGALLAWRFFRDPERFPPGEKGVVVSPADGTVLYLSLIHI